jgi:membrane-bound metal-dependent hydrolase YbcI (DUF457 family)
MPGYKGHLTAGLVTAGAAIGAGLFWGKLTADPLQMAGLTGFCLLGAMFPDVDTDSKGQNLFYAVFIAVDAVLIYYHDYRWAAWLGLAAMLPALGHHRGWTHTWWAMLAVGLPIVIIPKFFLGSGSIEAFLPFYIAFTLGYFSHLLLDWEFY